MTESQNTYFFKIGQWDQKLDICNRKISVNAIQEKERIDKEKVTYKQDKFQTNH